MLGAALDVLGREAPAHHDLLCAELAALPVDLSVDREVFGLRSIADRVVLTQPGETEGSARVALRTDLATALALLDARLTVLEAVQRGRLDVRGSAAALCAAAEALSTFLHGLIRCPSGGALLHDLRAHVRKER